MSNRDRLVRALVVCSVATAILISFVALVAMPAVAPHIIGGNGNGCSGTITITPLNGFTNIASRTQINATTDSVTLQWQSIPAPDSAVIYWTANLKGAKTQSSGTIYPGSIGYYFIASVIHGVTYSFTISETAIISGCQYGGVYKGSF